MTKKILITHIATTLNYGSAMMAINLISRIKPFLNDTEIYCECDNYNLDRIKKGTQLEDIKPFESQHSRDISIGQKFKKYILGKDPSISSITDHFDMMIILGGDDLSETYKKGAILRGSIYHSINKKCRVILAGQSFGPFSGTTKLITKRLYKNIPIITRDDNSFEFSKGLGIKDVIKSRDLALLALPNQGQFGEIIEQLPTEGKEYITLVPSGLWSKYTSDQRGYTETWIGIINLVKQKFPKHMIILLGHVLGPPKSDDRVSINKILQGLSKQESQNVVPITNELQPAEARQILGGSKLVITGRMHAAVSTFFMRKPAISLAYSEKYSGVIGRGLDLADLIIESRNRNWGKNSEIIDEIDAKVDYILNSYGGLVKKIDQKVDECSKMVEDQINFILKEINALPA
ncbi:polysaccharide pyruvyl transferase family protein [Echinicola sp. CAU 1574]|uniref:Polysaccharide pyruvyl transferase family protein n=1 Tax=Echinicola arenosa TaxID=2774144 RepID=A0ABR9ANW9_9BACT|nr:polysaccharide pyruvyl transferase family protein [Echinicola arenosa]MBD8490483.1 polysaccharide pyruvyl transferase family protein [Echinicola arenosa]